MNNLKPIQRSAQLQPLSREHHDGLLFIWKLRQGLANKVPTDVMSKYASWYWKHHIKAHFFQEEKILLNYIDRSNPLAQKLKTDHDNIREMVLKIGKDADNYDFFWLCNLLESHIRFEEREFFAFLESELTEDQLTEIYVQLEKHPVTCEEEWNEEFWIKPVAKRQSL